MKVLNRIQQKRPFCHLVILSLVVRVDAIAQGTARCSVVVKVRRKGLCANIDFILLLQSLTSSVKSATEAEGVNGEEGEVES